MATPELSIGSDIALLDARTATEAVDRAAIDIQIATARAFPRSLARFLREAETLATLDEETAATMFYTLRRGGKNIEGPSVRMAEIIVYSWGNLRVDTRVTSIDQTFVTAMGTAFDLERNVAVRHEVKRRITDKDGKRYNDDMIVVTCNAASSIAMREAVFKAVPRSLFASVYQKAKLTSIGKAQTMEARRAKVLEWCGKIGVSVDRVLRSLGRKGTEEITVDDLVTLAGIKTAIKDGDTTVDDAFPPEGGKPSERAASLDERLAQAAAGKASAPAPTPAAVPELDRVGLADPAPVRPAEAAAVAADVVTGWVQDVEAADPLAALLAAIWSEPVGGGAVRRDRLKIEAAVTILPDADDRERAKWFARHEDLGAEQAQEAARLARAFIDHRAAPAAPDAAVARDEVPSSDGPSFDGAEGGHG